jgi:hypothetical protein
VDLFFPLENRQIDDFPGIRLQHHARKFRHARDSVRILLRRQTRRRSLSYLLALCLKEVLVVVYLGIGISARGPVNRCVNGIRREPFFCVLPSPH